MLKELNNIFKVSKGRWKETELKRRNNIYSGDCRCYLGHCENLPLRKHLPHA